MPTRQLTAHRPRARAEAPTAGQFHEPLIGWLTALAPVLVTALLVGQFSATTRLGAASALVLFVAFRRVGLRPIHAAEAQIRSALVRARARGSQADYEIRDLVRGSLALATGAGVAGGLALVGTASTITRLGESGAAATAAALLLGLAPALTPSLWFAALARCAAALRRPRVALWAGIPATFAIVGSEWLTRLGDNGTALTHAPARVALGVGLAYLLGCALLRTLARRDPVLAPVLSLAGWRASWLVIRRLLRLTRPRRAA